MPAGPYGIAVRDVNGDGRPDLVTANHDNTVSVLAGNGDGTFQAYRSFATGAGAWSITVADFNGDGRPDIATSNGGEIHSGFNGTIYLDPTTVSVLLGNGDGTFKAQQTFAVGSSPSSIAMDDFIVDGRPDLATANGTMVSVLLGNGDGSFQTQQTFAVGSGPGSAAVGDFNGDGLPDLARANAGSNTVSVLLNASGLSTPTLAAKIADRTAPANTAFSFRLPAGTFTDPNNDPLTYRATLASGAALPSWLNFDAASQTFSGTVPAGTTRLAVRVTATDPAGASAFGDFTLSADSSAKRFDFDGDGKSVSV